MTQQPVKFIAVCAAGFEQLVEEELISFGAEGVAVLNGSVFFNGPLETAYRACLWSRYASRILLMLADFTACDTDELYKGVSAVEWSEHFGVNETFAVECVLRRSSIKHSRYAALRTKDAIADYFMERFKRRPSVEVKKPDIQIHIMIEDEKALVSLDISGDSLHRRGYRVSGVAAPLKESLAAGILKLAGWCSTVSPDKILVDPMCGSGTLLIEAALMCFDIAPGLGRNYFGFTGWRGNDALLWERLVDEAKNRRIAGLKKNSQPQIIGYDASREAVNAALSNIDKASLRGLVHVERKELARLQNSKSDAGDEDRHDSILIVNPPYAERLGSLSETRYLYRCLGRKLREEFAGWRAGVFTNQVELADAVALKMVKGFRLYNGSLPCKLYIYDVPIKKGVIDLKRQEKAHSYSHDAEFFANRLKKNIKHLSKWKNRELVSCYRIYDADIPEYNIAVDIYEQCVHVQEYAPPKTVDPAKAEYRFRQALRAIQDVLGVHKRQVFIKVRQKQKGSAQYQKKIDRGKLIEVEENSCRFLVNMTDYIDTGLFLDHRITRAMIRDKAEGARFLNLFSYTSTATVYAAAGGAVSTVSVDSSPVYTQWARSNLSLNGFSEENHTLIQADCMDWLSKSSGKFNLIFADPPTFSNSKRRDTIFDLQRDHVGFIRQVMRRLAPGGLLIFSTNFNKFHFDSKSLSEFSLQDVSRKTISPDFQRNRRIHQCWNIQHGSKRS